MRLPMFDVMDASITLLESRREFYQSCAYELQELISAVLAGEALLSVSARVKKSMSLREKMLRKRLYLEYDNPYDLLTNLSDLVGLRAECRFIREESSLYKKLCAACSMRHKDGMFSVPSHPNIRFELSVSQPQTQQNGLGIYRIDGMYHKNGVSTPFELQIKALVHVFWTEVEHQLIYKNSAYMLIDTFLKDLLYSNYERLRQIDSHLQLIYDQTRSPARELDSVKYANFKPIVAKTLSDVFTLHMKNELGFSVRLDKTCDTLAYYLISRGENAGKALSSLMTSIHNAATNPIFFGEALELESAFSSDEPFIDVLGRHLFDRINTDYDYNLFFRLLFALEQESATDTFLAFLEHYRRVYADKSLYSPLSEREANKARECVTDVIADLLAQYGDISMFGEPVVMRVRGAIRRVCDIGCYKKKERVRHVIEAAIRETNTNQR